MTAGEIADYFSISKPSISHHLDLLKQADVVVAIKEGQFITYSLNSTVFDDMVKWEAGGTKPTGDDAGRARTETRCGCPG